MGTGSIETSCAAIIPDAVAASKVRKPTASNSKWPAPVRIIFALALASSLWVGIWYAFTALT